MRRLFLHLPLLALAVFFAARLLLPDEAIVDRAANVVAFLVATGGCLAAALAFRRGDYLRTAWLLQSLSYAILVATAWIQRPGLSQPGMAVRVGLIFLANVLGVAGTFLFARTYHVAGLELPWSRRAQVALGATVALLAVAAAGPPLVIDLPPAFHGDLDAISGAASSAGDLVTLALIAPLFLTALALRGGLLVWPWGLFTASTAVWLVYDAQDTVSYLVPALGEEPLHIVTVPLRILACVLVFAAGLAQRRVSLGVSTP